MRALAKLAWSLLLLAGGTVGADSGATLAAPNTAFERVGQIGGETLAVAIAGTFAYVPTGPRVAVLDVSDPSRPTLVGQSVEQAEALTAVAAFGPCLYTALAAPPPGVPNGLVLQVADPSQPMMVGQFGGPARGASHLVVADTEAYVVDSLGLHVLELADPTRPVEVGSNPGVHADPDSGPPVVADGHAYVGGQGLQIVDVSDPSNPLLVGTWSAPSPRRIQGVVVAGGYAYVAADGLHILDVSDPSSPVEVASIGRELARARGLAVSGSWLYVADPYAQRLVILDITDPTQPVLVGSAPTGLGPPQRVVVDGTHAYVAAAAGGLRVFDVADAANPVEVGAFQGPGSSAGTPSIAVGGQHAYVADGSNGFHVLDVADPAHPTEVGFYRGPRGTDAWRVALVDSYAYVLFRGGGEGQGLRVLDVGDPTRPSEVAALRLAGSDLAVAGRLAYVAAGGGVRIVDLTDPAQPTEVAAYLLPLPAALQAAPGVWREVRVAVTGQRLVVAFATLQPTPTGTHVRAEGSGLAMVDVSDPRHPREEGVYQTLWIPYALAASGSVAYVLDRGSAADSAIGGLHVMDLADPTRIVEADLLPGNEGPFSGAILLAGHDAYLTQTPGLLQLDLSDPRRPTTVASYPGRIESLAVAGPSIYLGLGANGVEILHRPPG